MKRDYRRARLTARQKALARFAVKMTRQPASVRPRDLVALRSHGLKDRDILDAVQVISYFNYINRIADALGIDSEPEMRSAGKRRKMKGHRRRNFSS